MQPIPEAFIDLPVERLTTMVSAKPSAARRLGLARNLGFRLVFATSAIGLVLGTVIVSRIRGVR
jgi:hypothetical protein